MKSAATDNLLLAALSTKERQRIVAQCEPVQLVSPEVLHQAGTRLRDVYFPTGSFISMVTPLDTCASLEVALVGREGMVGIPLLLGVAASPLNHVVQGTGGALRMEAAAFQLELKRSAAFRNRLGRYAYVKVYQLAQTAACTRFHTVEERLARWLLMAHDRSGSNSVHATHEFLAYMLGVRRAGITKAATSLQQQAHIRYYRGDIAIVNRRGLQGRACGCYAAATAMYEQILG
jgi:CRP-like cAMP-binding protein